MSHNTVTSGNRHLDQILVRAAFVISLRLRRQRAGEERRNELPIPAQVSFLGGKIR